MSPPQQTLLPDDGWAVPWKAQVAMLVQRGRQAGTERDRGCSGPRTCQPQDSLCPAPGQGLEASFQEKRGSWLAGYRVQVGTDLSAYVFPFHGWLVTRQMAGCSA